MILMKIDVMCACASYPLFLQSSRVSYFQHKGGGVLRHNWFNPTTRNYPHSPPCMNKATRARWGTTLPTDRRATRATTPHNHSPQAIQIHTPPVLVANPQNPHSHCTGAQQEGPPAQSKPIFTMGHKTPQGPDKTCLCEPPTNICSP